MAVFKFCFVVLNISHGNFVAKCEEKDEVGHSHASGPYIYY